MTPRQEKRTRIPYSEVKIQENLSRPNPYPWEMPFLFWILNTLGVIPRIGWLVKHDEWGPYGLDEEGFA